MPASPAATPGATRAEPVERSECAAQRLEQRQHALLRLCGGDRPGLRRRGQPRHNTFDNTNLGLNNSPGSTRMATRSRPRVGLPCRSPTIFNALGGRVRIQHWVQHALRLASGRAGQLVQLRQPQQHPVAGGTADRNGLCVQRQPAGPALRQRRFLARVRRRRRPHPVLSGRAIDAAGIYSNGVGSFGQFAVGFSTQSPKSGFTSFVQANLQTGSNIQGWGLTAGLRYKLTEKADRRRGWRVMNLHKVACPAQFPGFASSDLQASPTRSLGTSSRSRDRGDPSRDRARYSAAIGVQIVGPNGPSG